MWPARILRNTVRGNLTASTAFANVTNASYDVTGAAINELQRMDQIQNYYQYLRLMQDIWGGAFPPAPTPQPGMPIETFGTSSGAIRVANFSKEGEKQGAITNVLALIRSGLSSDLDCQRWLKAGGIAGADLISALLDANTFGHGEFNVATVAAFAGSRNADGTPAGVPPDSAFTVNDNGAFFSQTYRVGVKNYTGGTLEAQAAIIIHELAHILTVAGFVPDVGSASAGRRNDELVEKNCGNLIRGLK